MFDYTKTELTAGAFLLLGLAVLGYLSLSIGGFTLARSDRYRVVARFSNVGDLKAGAPIKMAGVTIGKVESIRLADYFGEAELAIDRAVVLPRDTIASVATSGLLGDAYVSLSPGASDSDLKGGDRLTRTEPALNLLDLIARYAFKAGASEGGGGGEEGPSSAPPPPPARPPPAAAPGDSAP